MGTAVKILIGVAIGIVAVIVLVGALAWTALDIVVNIGESEYDRMDVTTALAASPESVEFKRLYPEYTEDTTSIVPPNYRYELRSIDEDGSVFETDSLIIEYNADTGESKSTYLCTEPDGDRTSYDRGDLAEAMEGVCKEAAASSNGAAREPAAREPETKFAAVSERLAAYPESVEFMRLYPEYTEDTISILPPNYQYELRSIEGGSVFETDSLIIEYNADTGESKSTYLCTEPDGDRTSYDRGDLAEVMASICG